MFKCYHYITLPFYVFYIFKNLNFWFSLQYEAYLIKFLQGLSLKSLIISTLKSTGGERRS